MPNYVIETPAGRRLTIEAETEAAAMAGARQWHEEQNATSAADYVQPAPPPGEIIHDVGRSYISDRPEISAQRPADGDDRGAALVLEALKARGATADGPAAYLTRKGQPFTQGQSLGFGDELISAIVGGVDAARGGDFRGSYDRAQEFQRQELERQREESPLTSVGLEMAGGLATGGALASRGATIVGRMANRGMSNLAARTGAGAAEGALYGGASGFGSAEGSASERARAAADDALFGAAFGTAAVPAVDAVMASGGRYIGNAISALRRPEQRADDILIDAIMRDQTTPTRMADDIIAAITAGQPEFAAVDAAGRNVQRAGAMAAKTPGPFREQAATTLAARQQGQGDRIGGFVDDAIGDGSAAYGTERALLASRRAAAEPLYAEAYRASPPRGPAYDEMLNRQSVRDAVRSAERTAAERQIPVSDLFVDIPNPNARTVARDVPSNVLGADGRPIVRTERETVGATVRVPTMRGWDFIKRELDGRVNQLYAAGDTTAAEAVKETRNALRSQLATDNEAYGRALARYADDSAGLEAIQTGRNLANARNADEARAAFDGLNEGQRGLARTGAAREFGTKLDNMRAGQDKTLPFDTPNMTGKLDTLIDDPTVRAVFDDRIGRERAMVRSNRQMQGGSSTFENLADADALNETVMAKLARGNVGGAVLDTAGRMLGFIGRTSQGMNEEVAQRVGSYLLSADPDEIRRLTAAFEAMERGNTDRGQFVARLLAAVHAPGNEDR